MQILIIGANPETKGLLALLQTLDSVEPVVLMHTDDDYTETYRDVVEGVLPYYIDDRFYDFDEFVYYMDMIKAMLLHDMFILRKLSKRITTNVTMRAKCHFNKINVNKGLRRRVC